MYSDRAWPKVFSTVLLCILLLNLSGCDGDIIPFRKKKRKKLSKETYEVFKRDVVPDNDYSLSDSSNIFDQNEYDPEADSIEEYLVNIGRAFEEDSSFIRENGMNDSGILSHNFHRDSLEIINDTFSNEIENISSKEIKVLKYNLEAAKKKELLPTHDSLFCIKSSCKIRVHVSKKKQRLYLFVDGAAVDTFKVSTGDEEHETPEFETHPNGLMFQKYTSKKFPGGNYNGMGNMPYVVFIDGGYGIHGTTISNFKKLGTKASHGCIRLHPNHAKLLFELVESAGAENTWISVSEQ